MKPAWLAPLLVAPLLAGCFGGDAPAATHHAIAGDPFLYAQMGGDEGRTGDLATFGPVAPPNAVRLELPGVPAADAPPLFVAGSLYLLLTRHRAVFAEDTPQDRFAEGLYRVDLATLAVEPIVGLSRSPTSLASDGDRFYVAEADRLAAYALDGTEAWSWSYPDLFRDAASGERRNECAPPAIRDGSLVIGCTQYLADVELVVGDVPEARTPAAFAARFDLGAGAGTDRVTWQWLSADRSPMVVDAVGPAELAGLPCIVPAAAERISSVTWLGDKVILVLAQRPEVFRRALAPFYIVAALEEEDASFAWAVCTEPAVTMAADVAAGGDLAYWAPRLTGTDETAFLLHDDLWALHLDSGAAQLITNVGPDCVVCDDLNNSIPGTGMATETAGLSLRSDFLYGQAYGDAFAFDLRTNEFAWRVDVSNPWKGLGPTYPLAADRTIYVAFPTVVAAFNMDDGGLRWRYDIPYHSYPTFAVADGVLALVLDDASVTLFGSPPTASAREGAL